MKLTTMAALCIVFLIVVEMRHLYLSMHDLNLAFSHIQIAFWLGIIAGLSIAALGFLLKHPLGGMIAGACLCYLLAIGYLVIWVGIPVEWIY